MSNIKKLGYAITFFGIILLIYSFTGLSYKVVFQGYEMDKFLKNQETMSSELEEKIEDYNKKINLENTGIVDPFISENIEQEKYDLVDGIFGYLDIPKINLKKPIYLGATYDNLSRGLAQIDDTSIPVGGKSTRSVIAGHRGWDGDFMLLKIDELSKNDLVYVRHHGKKLTYKVTDKEIISPSDWEKLKIVKGKDILTLLSCDPPYPPFANRIIVNCIRVDTESETKDDSKAKINNTKKVSAQSNKESIKSSIIDYIVVLIAIISWIMLIINIYKFIKELRKNSNSDVKTINK